MRFAAILLLLAACHREPPPPAHIFSGKIDNLLMYTDKIEVRRVGREGYAVRVGPDVKKALTDVLLSGSTYDKEDVRACEFTPDYLIDFYDRDRMVQMAVSFDCRAVEARPNALLQDQTVRKRFGRTNGGRQLHLLLTQLVPLR